jgi:hypothetical protein
MGRAPSFWSVPPIYSHGYPRWTLANPLPEVTISSRLGGLSRSPARALLALAAEPPPVLLGLARATLHPLSTYCLHTLVGNTLLAVSAQVRGLQTS